MKPIEKRWHPLQLFVTLLALVISSTGCASMRTSQLEIDIIDDDGRSFPQYPTRHRHQANTQRHYLQAQPQSRYAIRVRNHSYQRVGVVIAVDGRNIISGQKSHLRPTERMYILGPYETATYRGWRTDSKRVHRFYFTDVEDSYADAWDDRSAMGVIAVAAYPEKVITPQPRKKLRSMEDAFAPGRNKAEAEANSQAGTGFGEETWSPSVQVHFNPDRHQVSYHYLKYEWRDQLCQRGIIRCPPDNRFWPDEDRGYVPYPPGYRAY